MKNILTILFLAAAFASFNANACSCVQPGSVQQEKAQSTRVFVGRVTAVEERTPQMDRGWLTVVSDWIKSLLGATASHNIRDSRYKRVSFSVTETFKGNALRELQLATGFGGGDCGYSFEPGQDYVVYAHGTERQLEAGICSLTGPASDPNSGLLVLRDGS